MKNSRLQLVILALVFSIVVASARGVEAKFYTAYISDGPDTSIAYWLAKEVGLFKKHGLDMELIFIGGLEGTLLTSWTKFPAVVLHIMSARSCCLRYDF